ncbi:MAG: carboxypeptidase-like regulatory domain-containing protein, partial [Planctomycetota bacterium]
MFRAASTGGGRDPTGPGFVQFFGSLLQYNWIAVMLIVLAAGCAPKESRPSDSAETAEPVLSAGTERLLGSRRVRGRVLLEGAPVPATQVLVLEEDSVIRRVRTDSDGKFETTFTVPRDCVRLEVQAPGLPVAVRELRDVGVGEGIDVGDFSLLRGPPLDLRVRSSAGPAIGIVRVRLSAERGGTRYVLHGQSDENGALHFSSVPTGPLSVRFQAVRHADEEFEWEHSGGIDLEAEMQFDGQFFIKLIDSEQREVHDALITLGISKDDPTPIRRLGKGEVEIRYFSNPIWFLRVTHPKYET